MGKRILEDYPSRSNWLIDRIRQMKLNRQAVVVEIGVWKADFTATVFQNKGDLDIKWIGIDPFKFIPGVTTKVTTQESWDGIHDRVKAKVSQWGENYELIRAESVDAINQIDCIDLLFIDGNHSYEMVRSDLELYAPLVNVGGIVSGHDYQLDTVRKAVDEYAKSVRRNLTIVEWGTERIFWYRQTKNSKKLSDKICLM